MTRIVVVEDDPHVAAFVEKGLRASGFVTEVVANGNTAIADMRHLDPDLMILDMGLPGADGIEVLRAIRATGSTVPIIVLTGNTERDAVMCLEAGADDYMRKPFHFGELLARVHARLRDARVGSATVIQVGGISLDLRTRRAHIGNREVDLTTREFALLETFMRHPDQVLTREQILSHVWGFSFDPSSNLVNVYVNVLRKKLGPHVVETVRGAGYRLPR